jgi:hypothetical protein
MEKINKFVFLSAIIAVAAFSFFNFSAVANAATPTLSLTNNGDGDTVQVIVNGDPNVSVILYYTKSGAGGQISSLGNTNSNGYFSMSISTSSYQIAPSSPVYVTTNGISGPASNSIVWPIATSSSTTGTISLSQTGVVLTVGQSTTVNASGVSSLYLSNNSNPPVANINVNGSTITILAITNGNTVATVCSSSSTSTCSSIYVTVQNSGTQALTFGQNNVTIVSGQNVPISISGGTGVYMVQNNPNSAVVQTSISGSVITLSTASTSGSSSITVCSTDMSSCGIINITVGTTGSSVISFVPSSPTVSIGQGTSVTISGASGGVYYISSNSNPSIAQVTLSSNTLTIIGNTNGSSVVSVCSSLGSCGSITITVNYVASGGNISLSQTSLTLLTGQTLSIVVSGGTSPYTVVNPSPNIAQTTLSGNILTVYGAAVGSESLSVCSAEGGCIPLSVLVNGSGTTSQVVLGQTSLSLVPAQTATVTVSGSGNYYVSNNSNPGVASAQISASSVIVTATTVGADNISICQNGGQCAVLLVTVSAPTAQTNTTVTTVTQQSSYVLPRYLGFGDNGEDVLQLQKILSKEGFLSAASNGHYGPATKAAVLKFQKAHGIKQTGNVGKLTKDAIDKISTPSSDTTSSTKEQQISAIQAAIQKLMAQISQIQGQ